MFPPTDSQVKSGKEKGYRMDCCLQLITLARVHTEGV